MSDVQPGTAAANTEQADAASNDAAAAAQGAVNAEQASQEQATGTQQAEQNAEQGAEQATAPEGIDALPDWAQKEIRDLRKESGNYRTKAKETEEAVSTAQAEKDDLIQQIGKALGLVEDTQDDPAKLLEAATKREQERTAERDGYQKQLRELKQGAAIRDAADVAKVTDPALLEAVLRSDNAFNELDINADDFDAQVVSFVAKKVESHPALAQVAPTASGVDTSNTNTGTPGKLTRADYDQMMANREYDKINDLFAENKFNFQ